MSEPAQDQARIRVTSVRSLVSILQAVKPSGTKQQVCCLQLGKDGLSLRWEDLSKSMQSSVFLSCELFASFQCPWVRRLCGISFTSLTDVLSVFATMTGADLHLRYPGPDEELICEMSDEQEDRSLCTFARINTQEVDTPRDFTDFWKAPESSFVASGALIKEAVEDLEWGALNHSLALYMRASPPQLKLSSHDSGDLSIQLPVSELDALSCGAAEISHTYKYKLVRGAFANLPAPKDASNQIKSKVTIDSQGVMKITHMGIAGGGSGNSPHGQVPNTQRSARSWVQFMILPEEASIEEE